MGLPAKMIQLFCLVAFCLVAAKAEFSPELQEAIDYCGGITSLTDGACPPNPTPVDTTGLDKTLKNAKNVKVCQAVNIPELSSSDQSWKSTKLTGLKVNMHFNETNGRYGFGDGKFLMILKYKPSEDVPNLAGRVVGYLPELPNEPSCPIAADEETTLATDMAFEGTYYRGIPVNMKIELFSTATPQNTCVTQDSIAEFGDPIVCFIIQGYFL